MKVNLNTMEARVIALLRRRYPITTDELRKELSVRRDTLDRVLKRLAAKGVLILEPLPDKTYVRLLLPGVEPAAEPSIERSDKDGDDDSIAYR
ncbi:MAG: MarR family transcriptional regulator [Methanobacteriota archaeon]|nr:MAG: MarR family transcriptional regulator [Euryarchaeota archaeon]